VPAGTPEFEARAVEGVGVFETLKAIVRSCLALVGDPSTLSDGRSPSVLPGRRASMYPGGRPSASTDTPADGEPSPAVPPPPRVPSDAEDA